MKKNNEQAKKLQIELKILKFLIIDEMPLIGLRILYQIKSRCRETHANEINELFGGITIIHNSYFFYERPKDKNVHQKSRTDPYELKNDVEVYL